MSNILFIQRGDSWKFIPLDDFAVELFTKAEIISAKYEYHKIHLKILNLKNFALI